uniref:Reverse transcriptase zinc-binding domain-containing protein n=1 Tax=Quercus lobata TaxID=97700 RepID=A0A7N2KKA3_QUELO
MEKQSKYTNTVVASKEPWYTCKSGYRFLKEEAESALERTQVAFETQLWKKLWMLEVPNMVKNHVWRACRDSLPTKQNLMQHIIITNALCDRCKQLPETTLHAVWTCPKLDELIPRAYHVADMEAIAATRALEFAREIGITDAILEGDSCLVHHALTRGEQSLSPFGLLVEDLKFLQLVLYITLLSYKGGR